MTLPIRFFHPLSQSANYTVYLEKCPCESWLAYPFFDFYSDSFLLRYG